MKKLFVVLVLGIFLISIVSAYEIDNIKNYNSDLKEVVVKNAVPEVKKVIEVSAL